MKKTMTSINPPFSNLILDGNKKIEWRTKPLPLGWSELYETKKKGGLGKVIGQFEVVENIKVDLFELACNDEKGLIEKGCVDWGFLNDYATLKRSYLYANVIDRVERYDKPKELSEFYSAKWDMPCENKKRGFNMDFCMAYENGSHFCKELNCDKKRLTRPPQSWQFIETGE
jgi:predicted transcriptional regulator